MNPKTEEELSSIIKDANGHLKIEGGGTRGMAERISGDTLSMAKYSGITLYEPGALTIVAKAGTPLAEIEKALAKENQQLPFEPMDHCQLLGTKGKSTIGGVVAANISGPRRLQAGACRDSLIGVRFVDGAGNILKNGGRVMKNVTGYDLVKLMGGSFGTLGVLTEVSFKVLPKPETSASIVLSGLNDEDAIAACSRALSSPFDITGAVHVGGETVLRIEGFKQSVEYRSGELLKLFSGVELLDEKTSQKQWQAIRDVTHFANHAGDIWRISVKPTDGPLVANAMREKFEDVEISYDWAGGLLWVASAKGDDIRSTLDGLNGHATLVKGDGYSAFQPQNSGVAKIEASLRGKFDPKGILNAGLMD